MRSVHTVAQHGWIELPIVIQYNEWEQSSVLLAVGVRSIGPTPVWLVVSTVEHLKHSLIATVVIHLMRVLDD
jgi:hypothetical protein